MRFLTLFALALATACAEEPPPPSSAPPAPLTRAEAKRPRSDDYIGELRGSWVWPGPDGTTDLCIEIRRSWQWANSSVPTDWRPPPIEAPEPNGLVVLGCELYLRGRRYATCTIERRNVESGWKAPREVDAEEVETRYYVGRAAARAGREACEGEWLRAPR